MKANEPAFPVVANFAPDDGQCSQGITTRDYFAIKAMQGYMASCTERTPPPKEIAKIAYEYADAMIAESQKVKE